MEIMEFCEKVKSALEQDKDNNTEVRIQRMSKNNGVVLHGLSLVKPRENITPTLYLENFLRRYEAGETFADIMREIRMAIQRNRVNEDFDVTIFTDFDKAKKRIVYKLINVEKNRELLNEVPHMLYMDMAIVFYYLMEKDLIGGYATILVHNSHMRSWSVQVEDLYSYALANTRKLLPPVLLNMEDMMLSIMKGEQPDTAGDESLDDILENINLRDDHYPMYVLTNRERYYGAITVLYPEILERISEEMGRDLYVIPSSVHEMILIPDLKLDNPENLIYMIREVNEHEVKEEEVLSDSLYYYDRNAKELRIFHAAVAAMQ